MIAARRASRVLPPRQSAASKRPQATGNMCARLRPAREQAPDRIGQGLLLRREVGWGSCELKQAVQFGCEIRHHSTLHAGGAHGGKIGFLLGHDGSEIVPLAFDAKPLNSVEHIHQRITVAFAFVNDACDCVKRVGQWLRCVYHLASPVWKKSKAKGNCMTRLAIIAALALAGCATPTSRIEIRAVSVPVPVACIAAADVPQRPARLARPLPDDADALLSLALAQILRWQAFGDKADALMTACTVSAIPPIIGASK
jgi:hypothetical protein